MDYFRSLGTSLLQQSGVVLPFALGDKVDAFDRLNSIWTMWDAVKRVSSSFSLVVFARHARAGFLRSPELATSRPAGKLSSSSSQALNTDSCYH